MSSFIPSAKHFKSIEATFIDLNWNDNFYYPYDLKEDFPNLYSKNSAKQMHNSIKDVVGVLAEITALCVCLQYRHEHEGTLDKAIEDNTIAAKAEVKGYILTKTELYKALSCVKYQIELEHLKDLRSLTEREEKAMKFLRVMIFHLAEDIVSGTALYDAARWEIS